MASLLKRVPRIVVRLSLANRQGCACKRRYTTRLVEVGILEKPKDPKTLYSTGQLFLHRVLDYRGVILFSWTTKMNDRDVEDKIPDTTDSALGVEARRKSSQCVYYLVMMDRRDYKNYSRSSNPPYMYGTTMHVGASTNYLHRQEDHIEGLDIVAHEEIQPYTSKEDMPIHHDAYDQFFTKEIDRDSSLVPQRALNEMTEVLQPRLKLTQVYRQTTDDISVTVLPVYQGYRVPNDEHWWHYCVRLKNHGQMPVKIQGRCLTCFNHDHSTLEKMEGKGLNIFTGNKYKNYCPVLSVDAPVFQYWDHVGQQSHAGHVWGRYKVERQDGVKFHCKIPPFSLESSGVPDSSPFSISR